MIPNPTKALVPLLAGLFLAGLTAKAQTVVIPPSYALPPNSVDLSMPGFRVRPYQTAATSAGTLAWTEDQLAGVFGPNLADLSGADTNGYYYVSTVVNWNIAPGSTVDQVTVPSDPFPANLSGANFTTEVLTYVQFPAPGTFTLGVDSDDGFGTTVSSLNPKDRFNALSIGKFDGTRGHGITLFSVSLTAAGLYPMRLVYFQAGGGANVSWFSVSTNADLTLNADLINDLNDTNSLLSFAYATNSSVSPPYLTKLSHDPTGFVFDIQDDATALNPATLHVTLNGAPVAVSVVKTGTVTEATYLAPSLIPAGSSNTVVIQFADTASPVNNRSATISFIQTSYGAMPASSALPRAAVNTAVPGFVVWTHQIDSGLNGVLAANIAHAEAQLAGQLPFDSIASAGTEPNGSFIIPGVLNFSLNLGAEEGAFNTANGYPDAEFPGLDGNSTDNIAMATITYLDLQPGFYNFAVNHSDGFRCTVAANPYDVFGTPLGIFDYRSITTETQFGVVVQTAGIYPVRIIWFRMTRMADNTGDAGFEFYTINKDGSKVLVNDLTNPKAVKAYAQRTAGYGTYVKYAGPTSFVSPFFGNNAFFTNVSAVIADGSSNSVNTSSVKLSIDGSLVTVTPIHTGTVTSVYYTPPGPQVPRQPHVAQLVYTDSGGAGHTNVWNFNLLANYNFGTPLYFEDFESTATAPDQGTVPMVPTGWVAENHSGIEGGAGSGNDILDPANLDSDFYLGWVVIDRSFAPHKDFGVSAYYPQVFNGVVYDEFNAVLMDNHYMYVESDARGNGPPGQIDYVTTPSYDLTGKKGVVIGFNSDYEQNQDNIVGIEYTVDNGANWRPVFYFLQDGYDSQGVPDIIRDGLGNIDVNQTLLTPYGDVAMYTNNGVLVGGYYGFFLKAPITPALASYIEGRVNDDGGGGGSTGEGKRVEAYLVPGADNQPSVKFRFFHAGTSSWWWGIDNWGIYSAPSLAVTTAPALNLTRDGNTLNFTWASPGLVQLQKRSSLTAGTWQNVGAPTGAGAATDVFGPGDVFYRLALP